MEEQMVRFRESLRRLLSEGACRSGAGYPQELRQEAVELVREGLAQGMGLREVAVRLGICHATLYRWLGKREGPVRRVEIVPEPAAREELAGRLVLVTPGGYRVEGLGLGEVTRLLEVLR